jgi:hypothetical protein
LAEYVYSLKENKQKISDANPELKCMYKWKDNIQIGDVVEGQEAKFIERNL